MNTQKLEPWTRDWFELASTNEILVLIDDAKHRLADGPIDPEQNVWGARLKMLKQELLKRQSDREQREL